MCGRYVNYEDVEALAKALGIPASDPALQRHGARPRYNIAPTQEILGLRLRDGDSRRHEGASFHWGLVPFWAKEKSIGNRMINARSETVFEKPAFRSAIKKRRCVIPASGFYEWQKVSNSGNGKSSGGKQPHFIHRADNGPAFFAGIWETWKKQEPPLESCAILTTSANKLITPIHERMPVILDSSALDTWLDPDTDAADVAGLLQPCPDEWLAFHPVSTRVNKPANDDSDLIERIET